MKPAPFELHAPVSLPEAFQLVTRLENAKFLAGGQSLIAMMNFRFVQPDHLIDLQRIPELAGIEERDGVVRVGAMTRQRELEFSALIAQKLPLLRAGLAHVGHRQTRNRGTIGGSLSHADPSAELPLMALTCDAIVEVGSARGLRRIPAREFLRGYLDVAIEADEIVLAVEFPLPPKSAGWDFQEFARRHGDFAITACAVQLEFDGTSVSRAAIGLSGVADTSIRLEQVEAALVGKPIDAHIRRIVAAQTDNLNPAADIHASAEYRRHLAKMLTLRALKNAALRAGQSIAGL